MSDAIVENFNASSGDQLFYHSPGSEALALELDRVAFVNNKVPAVYSEDEANVVIRNCEGLASSDADTSDLIVCDNENIGTYCPYDYCTNAIVDIQCYCKPNGNSVDPSLGSCVSSAQITVPVTEYTVTLDKFTLESTLVLFASAGGTPLSWQMHITGNPEGLDWRVTPRAGNLSDCDIGNVTLTFDAARLHARSEAYITNFTLSSNSFSPGSRSVTIIVRAFVNADINAEQSSLVVYNTSQVVAESYVHFFLSYRATRLTC